MFLSVAAFDQRSTATLAVAVNSVTLLYCSRTYCSPLTDLSLWKYLRLPPQVKASDLVRVDITEIPPRCRFLTMFPQFGLNS